MNLLPCMMLLSHGNFSDTFKLFTEEQEIFDPLFTAAEVRVSIKRDDQIHPFISGNKWRKLKYILASVKEHGKTGILTFGGAYSNHLLATACLAAMNRFKSTGIVRGEKPEELNETLFLCQSFGMKLIFVSREMYQDKESLKRIWLDANMYYIPEGGSCREALRGCAEMVDEFKSNYSHIVLASGTATTATGIAMGIYRKGLGTRVESIVVLKGAEYLEKEFNYLPEHAVLPISYHHNFHCGGYAKVNPQLMTCMFGFSASTGILLEPVYTAKAFFALTELVKENYFPKKSSILFIHTGGLLGILGFKKYGTTS